MNYILLVFSLAGIFYSFNTIFKDSGVSYHLTWAHVVNIESGSKCYNTYGSKNNSQITYNNQSKCYYYGVLTFNYNYTLLSGEKGNCSNEIRYQTNTYSEYLLKMEMEFYPKSNGFEIAYSHVDPLVFSITNNQREDVNNALTNIKYFIALFILGLFNNIYDGLDMMTRCLILTFICGLFVNNPFVNKSLVNNPLYPVNNILYFELFRALIIIIITGSFVDKFIFSKKRTDDVKVPKKSTKTPFSDDEGVDNDSDNGSDSDSTSSSSSSSSSRKSHDSRDFEKIVAE